MKKFLNDLAGIATTVNALKGDRKNCPFKNQNTRCEGEICELFDRDTEACALKVLPSIAKALSGMTVAINQTIIKKGENENE